jgi:hypothetical protein
MKNRMFGRSGGGLAVAGAIQPRPANNKTPTIQRLHSMRGFFLADMAPLRVGMG